MAAAKQIIYGTPLLATCVIYKMFQLMELLFIIISALGPTIHVLTKATEIVKQVWFILFF